VEKISTAGEIIDDNMARVHFTLGTKGYKHTLSEYVICIVFLLQQCLQERASLLRYTDIACLVRLNKVLCIDGMFPC
jgi:hypothetical protein